MPDFSALVSPSGPATVGDLERALGIRIDASDVSSSPFGQLALPAIANAHPVTSVWAKYRWDMFHEEPARTVAAIRERKLVAFTVAFAEGIGAIERALVAIAPGRSLTEDRGRVHGNWVIRSTGDAGTLAHYAELPDWAVAPADVGTRARALATIFERAAAARDFATLAPTAATAFDGSGLVLRAVKSLPDRFDVDFVPAISACDLVSVLGWSEVAARSGDVHQTEWLIHQVTRTNEGVTLSIPVVGCWAVRARLDHRPTGGPLDTNGPTPPGGIHRLAPADLVRYVWLTSTS